jgi:mannose-6-phosphate isomerase-like protein (cupin superfamily)
MNRHVAATGFVLAILACGTAAGQTPAPEPDPGVRPTRLLDRPEVRVSRVELQPGATRSVHTHDDVEYHLWVPIEGSLQITMGTDSPIAAKPGQAYFMTRGTSHGFRNLGSTPGAVLEIFIKRTATVADRAIADALVAQFAVPGR